VAKAHFVGVEGNEEGDYEAEEAGESYFIEVWGVEVDQDWAVYWLG